MAEAVVSAVLDQLVSIIGQQVKQEVRLVKGVKKDVAKLNSNFQAIQAVVEDAEKKQISDARVRDWLEKLKDVSYDMDDVLDDWSSAILKSKIQQQEQTGVGNYLPDKDGNKKVCFPIPTSSLCFLRSQVKRMGMKRETAIRIRELNEKLDVIAIEKENYSFIHTRAVKQLERQKTTSLVDVSQVFGRENDANILINMLLENDEDNRGLTIIPIVGMGGIGKTTLAQLVFNDSRVKSHFDKQIWVCVSDPFDEIKIGKAIIEAFEMDARNFVELESIVQCIHKCIRGKRFLLVLDDVWTEDQEKWENLKYPLTGEAGSRILVTTRKREVAIMMRAETRIMNLGVLSEKDSWFLFSKFALFDRDMEDCEGIEEIGKEIARKCKGLPLAIKILGSLMRFKRSKTHWEEVLDNELWKLEDVKIKLFTPLLLSYYDLPPLEKRCFSYCSIFPKDYDIDKERLIQMWMSQGYLRGKESPEKAGQDCFNNLAMRSFFQDFQKNDESNELRNDGSVGPCKMHDTVHDFAQFLTDTECCIMEINEVKEEKEQLNTVSGFSSFPSQSHCFDKKVRHSTLVLPMKAELPSSICNVAKHLRSLFILCSRNATFNFGVLLPHLTRLRTLTLSRCNISILPEEIGSI